MVLSLCPLFSCSPRGSIPSSIPLLLVDLYFQKLGVSVVGYRKTYSWGGGGGPVASGFFQQLISGRGFPSGGPPVTFHSGVSGAHPHSASFMSSWFCVFQWDLRKGWITWHVLITIISQSACSDFSLKFLVCCKEVVMDRGIWQQVGWSHIHHLVIVFSRFTPLSHMLPPLIISTQPWIRY